MNWHRIKALLLRYGYVYSRNTFRAFDIVFWPFMDLLVWGYVSVYLTQKSVPSAVTFFIGAIIFFNILYRVQQALTVSFLEDIWSRNLLNIFSAPIKLSEFITATYLLGLAQAVIVGTVMAVSAHFLYSFELVQMGSSLIPLFLNLLLMGWALGMMTTAMILRYGHHAEALAWAVPFIIQPLSAVFYPVAVLPKWIQPVAYCLPSTHVFEGMRHILSGNSMDANGLIIASVLNVVYLTFAGFFFKAMFNEARKSGRLTKLVT